MPTPRALIWDMVFDSLSELGDIYLIYGILYIYLRYLGRYKGINISLFRRVATEPVRFGEKTCNLSSPPTRSSTLIFLFPFSKVNE